MDPASYFWFSLSSVQELSHVQLLQPHGLQHSRLPCPSPTPRACSNSCSLSQWCHLTISSSVIPLSCLQSFPAEGSFPMSQFFPSGHQSIGVSASASVLPMNIQGVSVFQFHGCSHIWSDFWSPRKNSVTASILSPSICHEIVEPDAMILVFLNVEFSATLFTLLYYIHQDFL